MPDLKPIHIALLIIVLIVGATYKAITYFAPMAFAEETEHRVAMMEQSQKLQWLESEKAEFELICTNKLTDEWVCSDKKRERYDWLVMQIQLLRVKLGLPVQEN